MESPRTLMENSKQKITLSVTERVLEIFSKAQAEKKGDTGVGHFCLHVQVCRTLFGRTGGADRNTHEYGATKLRLLRFHAEVEKIRSSSIPELRVSL